MYGFGVVGRKKEEGCIQGNGMSGEGKREMWEVVRMYLRFVCPYEHRISANDLEFGSVPAHLREMARATQLRTSAHHPLSIIADSYALASFLELKVLE